MGRVGIVSPLSVVPGFRVHLEEGRGRGSLSVFLLVPETPAPALSHALEILHDPRGPADLDQRLGELAATAPSGTAFLVALEHHVWVFPSADAQFRLLRDGAAEALNEPQVVRLADGERIEVVAARTGEAIALAAHAQIPEPPPAPRSPHVPAWVRLLRHPAAPRSAALLAGCAALGVFALFRVFAARPPESATERGDAWVAPDLEGRVLDMISDSSSRSNPPQETKSGDAENGEDSSHASADSPTPRNPGPPPQEWSFRARAAITSSPLLVSGSVVFGSRDSTVYCLDAEDGTTRWRLAAGSGVGSSPRAARGLVVFGTYAGRVIAAELKSGRVKWEGRTGGKIVASPCVLEDLVIVGSNDRRVHAFNLGSGEKIWAFEAKAPVRASAEAIGPERVVVGSTDGTIYAIDTARGRAAWTRAAGAAIVAGAAFDDDENRVIVGTQDGTVFCLEAEDGSVAWKTRLDSPVNAKPRMADDVALVGTGKGSLYALDRRSGKIAWTASVGRGFDATPAVVSSTVVAPAFDGTVHFLRIEDGSVRGKRSLGSRIWSSPASGAEIVYVGTFAGTFHALALP